MPRPQRPRRKTVTRYLDPDGRRCTSSTPGARKVTEQTDTWGYHEQGRWVSLDTEDEGAAWVELRRRQRQKADEAAGIRTPRQAEAMRPLAEWLVDFLDHLRSKGDGEQYVTQAGKEIAAILDGAGARTWADLDADRVAALLARWRKESGRGKRRGTTMSAKTSNHYRMCLVSFADWLAHKWRVANPLDRLRSVPESADRRHVRRTLTEDEFGRLLAAAEGSPRTVRGLSGPDRVMLYVLAAYTGLRAGALGKLTPALLRLADEPPTVTLAAAADKSRRGKTFPLHPDVAARLRVWLAGRDPAGILWPGYWSTNRNGAKLVQADLKAAGIPYQDEQGRVFDFHALRSQYLTGLARAGVPLAAAQKLAGHASPTTTARHYIILETADLAKEVAKLPPPPKRQP